MDTDRMRQKAFRLRLGAVLHFLIAAGHLACLFFLEEAFKAYGIWELVKRLCLGQTWMLYAVTVFLAIAFALAGLYALSASGDVRKLPLPRLVGIAIVAAYGIRTIIGIYWLASDFSCLQFFSTLVPAILVWCYMPTVR